MKEESKIKIIKAIEDKELSIEDMAKKLFISERQLKMLLSSWGVKLPGKRVYNKIPMPSREELMKIYQENNTTSKVAKLLGANVNTVNKWMKELKIPTRKMKMPGVEKIKFLEEHLDKLDI